MRVAVHRERHARVSEFVGQPWYAQLCLVVSLFSNLLGIHALLIYGRCLVGLLDLHAFLPPHPAPDN